MGRKAILSVACAACAMFAHGANQGFEQLWNQTYDGPAHLDDAVVGVVVDNQHAVYVLGQSQTSLTSQALTLVKYDQNGTLLWTRSYQDGTGIDTAKGIAMDGQKNVIITGAGDSGGAKGVEWETIKYDTDGNVLWAKKLNGVGGGVDIPSAIGANTDGIVAVAGKVFNGFNDDIAVVEYDKNGNQLFLSTMDGPGHGNDIARALALDASGGGMFITGKLSTSQTDSDCVTSCYGPSGALAWSKRITQPFDDACEGYAITYRSGNNVEVAGSGKDAANGPIRAFVTSYDYSVGNESGRVYYHAGDYCMATSLAMDKDDRALICGPSTVGGADALFCDASPTAGKGQHYGFDTACPPGSRCIQGFSDGRGYAYFLSNLGSAADGVNIYLSRLDGPYGGYNWDNGAHTDDFAVATAMDFYDVIYLVGTTMTETGHTDIVVQKLVIDPIAVPDTYNVNENGSFSASVANGVLSNDPGSDGGNAVLVGSAPSGQFQLYGDGSLFYLPPQGFVGVTSFQYKIVKGNLTSAPVTVTLNVEPPITDLSFNNYTGVGGFAFQGTVTIGAPEPADGTIQWNVSKPTLAITEPCKVDVGQTSATCYVGTLPVQSTQQFTVTASKAGVQISKVLTVNPGGLDHVDIQPGTVIGGDNASITATLTGPAPMGGVLVTLNSLSSYVTVPPTLTVPEGQTQATLPIQTSAVGAAGDKVVYAYCGTTYRVAGVTLLPTPKVTALDFSPGSFYGGQSTTGKVTVDFAPPRDVKVNLSSNSSVLHPPATMTVPQGQTAGTFNLDTDEVASTVTRTMTATIGASSKTNSVTLLPSPALSNLVLYPATVVGGQGTTGKVTLSATAVSGSVVVQLSSGSSIIHVPASVKVLQGQSTASFPITTSTVAATATRTVSATLNSVTKTANLTVTVTPALSSLAINPSTVKGGVSTTGTVTLSAPAGSGGVVVTLTDNSTAVNEPATVTVPAGATSVNFTITTSAVAAPATRTVSATVGAITKTATITLTP